MVPCSCQGSSAVWRLWIAGVPDTQDQPWALPLAQWEILSSKAPGFAEVVGRWQCRIRETARAGAAGHVARWWDIWLPPNRRRECCGGSERRPTPSCRDWSPDMNAGSIAGITIVTSKSLVTASFAMPGTLLTTSDSLSLTDYTIPQHVAMEQRSSQGLRWLQL